MPNWSKSVATPNASQAYRLSTLMAGVDVKAPTYVEVIQIQADPNGGAAKFWIGNADVSSVNHGVELVATQAITIQSLGGDIQFLGDMWLMSDQPSMNWNIFAIVR